MAKNTSKPWESEAAPVTQKEKVTQSPRTQSPQPQTRGPCRTTRLLLRVLFWYSVFLLYWKCPYGQELDTDAPVLCKPLHCGISKIEPVVKPYYDTYAEPYVLIVRPYYVRTKELNHNYVVPVVKRGGRASVAVYSRFVAPHVATVHERAEEVYEAHLKEHHEKASHYYNVYMQHVTNYYQKVRIMALTVYMDHVQPVFVTLEPYCDQACAFVRHTLFPRAKAYSLQSYFYIEKLAIQCYSVAAPKVFEIYEKNVEPQIIKIRERVNLYRHKPKTVVSTAGTVIIGVENPTESVESVDSIIEETIAESIAQEESTPTESAEAEKITPFKYPGQPDEADLAESALQYWKKKVSKQLEEAQASLNEEVNVEKTRLLRLLEPQFTEKLQHLSNVAQNAYITIDKVVADIIPHRFRKEFNSKYGPVAQRKRAADEEEEDDYSDLGTQVRIEPSDVQATFKIQAELLRQGAMDVRELASELAQTVIDRTEKVRLNTLEVLDEFAEFALKELAKTVVNAESFSHWKEYKQVKDSIIEAKEKMEKSDIPMEDINSYLREVQETANHLAREAAQALNGLRSKSDFYFQERHRMEDSEKVAKGEALADETPEDVEFYEPSAEEIAEEAAQEKKQRAKAAPFVEYDIEEDDTVVGDDDDDDVTYTLTQTQTKVVTLSQTVDVKPSSSEKPSSGKPSSSASSYGDFPQEVYEDEDDDYDDY